MRAPYVLVAALALLVSAARPFRPGSCSTTPPCSIPPRNRRGAAPETRAPHVDIGLTRRAAGPKGAPQHRARKARALGADAIVKLEVGARYHDPVADLRSVVRPVLLRLLPLPAFPAVPPSLGCVPPRGRRVHLYAQGVGDPLYRQARFVSNGRRRVGVLSSACNTRNRRHKLRRFHRLRYMHGKPARARACCPRTRRQSREAERGRRERVQAPDATRSSSVDIRMPISLIRCRARDGRRSSALHARSRLSPRWHEFAQHPRDQRRYPAVVHARP